MPTREKLSALSSAPGVFAEAKAWESVAGGWRPLFGRFQDLGFSLEWHDFHPKQELLWSRSFHPGSLELCLNLSGEAAITDPQRSIHLSPRSVIFYTHGEPPLRATRKSNVHHEFITVEYSPKFLRQHFAEVVENLQPLAQAFLSGKPLQSTASEPERLGTTLLPIIESLRHPPVFAPAQAIWFQCKALELAAQFFFRPPGGELFCTRQQRAARDRVERAQAILRQRMSEPPPLEELGKLVGCSPFYLSRLFSQEAGMTIQQYTRQIRMERAADLLRTGKCNVTEAAMEVGYSSLSHFSAAFHETFGCCPGLYPLKIGVAGSREKK